MNAFKHPLVRLAPVLAGCFLMNSCIGNPPETDVEDPPSVDNPPVAPPAAATDYPVAKPGEKPNWVISPYDATRVIDVSGFQSGQLARDPVTKQIFRVP